MKQVFTCMFAATAVVAISCAAFSIDAIAQDSPASAPAQATRSAVRKANWQLERNVRKALQKSKVDTANVSVLAHGNKITLDGTVPDETQVPIAATAAGSVQGVASVDNRLIEREPGN